MNPRIVCAANQYTFENGEKITIIGARHWDSHMKRQAKLIEKSRGVKIHNGTNEVQGFIDQFENFYTRSEAYDVADKNNQIIRDTHEKGWLCSENLY